MTEQLGAFEGKSVVGTRIKVTRAGDGLSKALRTEPRRLSMGQKVFVVLECEVGNVAFTETKESPTECLRLHTLIAGTASFIDEDEVKELLAEQAEKNRKMEEEIKGVQRLEDWTPDRDDLIAQHLNGDHDGLVIPGCPSCALKEKGNVRPIAARKKKDDS